MEYGGYLPLELPVTREYYSGNILKTNSARSAFYYTLKNIKCDKLYVPYYICSNMSIVANAFHFEVVKYNIDNDFIPLNISASKNDAILIVDYFGLNHDKIIDFCDKFHSIKILDNTQSFFSKPIDSVYNIYSLRKFFGVADGGYLINSDISFNIKLEADISYNKTHIVKSIDLGTNAAYVDFKNSESHLENNYKGMSLLTDRILNSIDYDNIMHIRRKNFIAIHNILGKYNLLNIKEISTEVPFAYPFLPDMRLHEKLIEKKIFVSTLWRELFDEDNCNQFEKSLIYKCVPVPIDQRYSLKDMEYLGQTILKLMR